MHLSASATQYPRCPLCSPCFSANYFSYMGRPHCSYNMRGPWNTLTPSFTLRAYFCAQFGAPIQRSSSARSRVC